MDAADVTVNFSLSGTNPKAVAHNSAVGRGGSRSVIALGGWPKAEGDAESRRK